MRVPSLSPSEKLAVGGSLLAIIGTILPWVATPEGTLPGYLVDGFTALLFAVPVLGVIALWEWGGPQQAAVSLLGLVVVYIAGNHAFAFGTRLTGIGTYVVFVAGVLIVGAGVYGYVAERRGMPSKWNVDR